MKRLHILDIITDNRAVRYFFNKYFSDLMPYFIGDYQIRLFRDIINEHDLILIGGDNSVKIFVNEEMHTLNLASLHDLLIRQFIKSARYRVNVHIRFVSKDILTKMSLERKWRTY